MFIGAKCRSLELGKMRKLVSYICTKCGAALNVESSHKEFDCPFCGNVFDFADIHYRELLSGARSALRHMEFVTAKKKFDEILASRPQDFEALLGLVLCVLKFRTEDSLKEMDKLKDCDVIAAKSVLAIVERRASEKDVPYFAKLAEMFDIVNRHTSLCASQAKLLEQNKNIIDKINRAIDDRDSAILCLVLISVVVSICTFFLIVARLSDNHHSYTDPITVTLIINGIVTLGIISLPVYGVIKANIRLRRAKARSVQTSQLRECDNAIAQSIKDFEQATISLGSLRPSMSESDVASSPSFAPKNTTNSIPSSEKGNGITCYMCAGELLLDDKHNFYRCDHCGVAYGSYLFTGDLLANALNAMERNEFFEADLNCQFELGIHPQNPQAHRLRILCAIKQTSFANLERTRSISNLLLVRMNERAIEAIKKVTPYDAVYFRQFLALANLYSRNAHIDSERSKLNKDKEHSKTELASYGSFSGIYNRQLARNELNVAEYELYRLDQQEAHVHNLIRSITELEIARNYIYPRR